MLVAALAVTRASLHVAVAGLLAAIASLGALRALPAPLPADHVARMPMPSTARIEGRIVAEPARTAPDRRRVMVDLARVDGEPRTGLVQLTVFGLRPGGAGVVGAQPERWSSHSTSAELAQGQRIRVEARLRRATSRRNPGGFDYAAFLARRDVHVVASAPAWRVRVVDDARPWHAHVRRRALAAIERALPPTSAALLGGLLLGARGDLPPEVVQRFRDAGVYHVLAVSGFNVALVASAVFVLGLGIRASPRMAAIAAIGTVAAFAAIVGPQPSVLRAVLMGLVVLGALLIEREASVLNTLALAAVSLLAVSPGDLRDPGFQLSFAATAGIVVAPLPRGVVTGAVGVSVAAQLAVLPIALSHFNQVSIIGVVANLAIVPLAAIATVVGLAAVAAATVSETVAGWLFDATWPVLLTMRAIVRLAASVPGALVHLPAPSWSATTAYVLALCLGLVAWRLRETQRRLARPAAVVAVTAMLLAVGLAAWPIVRPGDQWLRVTLLDVGQGDVAVVETPDRRTLVIHGRTGRVDVAGRVVAPFLWNRGYLSVDQVIAVGRDTPPMTAFSRPLPDARGASSVPSPRSGPAEPLESTSLHALGAPPLHLFGATLQHPLHVVSLHSLGVPSLHLLGAAPRHGLGAVPLHPLGTAPLHALGAPPLHFLGAPPLNPLGNVSLHPLGPAPLHLLGPTSLHLLGAAPLHLHGAVPLHALGAVPLHALGAPPLHPRGARPPDPPDGARLAPLAAAPLPIPGPDAWRAATPATAAPQPGVATATSSAPRNHVGTPITSRSMLGPVAVSPLGSRGAPTARDPVLAVRLDYGLATVLLASSLDAAAERRLRASAVDLRAVVLGVPRHGSRRATSAALVSDVQPAIAIVSVGARNPHGHPDAETIERIESAGAAIYRTDGDGAVTIETDGRVLDVTAWGSGRRARYCLDPDSPCAGRPDLSPPTPPGAS